jgi:Na+/melibiose symporter-like transporter
MRRNPEDGARISIAVIVCSLFLDVSVDDAVVDVMVAAALDSLDVHRFFIRARMWLLPDAIASSLALVTSFVPPAVVLAEALADKAPPS